MTLASDRQDSHFFNRISCNLLYLDFIHTANTDRAVFYQAILANDGYAPDDQSLPRLRLALGSLLSENDEIDWGNSVVGNTKCGCSDWSDIGAINLIEEDLLHRILLYPHKMIKFFDMIAIMESFERLDPAECYHHYRFHLHLKQRGITSTSRNQSSDPPEFPTLGAQI